MVGELTFKVIPVEKPEEVNVIIGRSHFIKTVEDIYEAIADSVPGAKFGIAFCEASGPRLIRYAGTDEEMIKIAVENCKRIGIGHMFFIALKNLYPINVLPRLKTVPEITMIEVATANPLQVIVAETEQGRALLGVVDGYSPAGVETEEHIKERKEFLRKIGYKL